MCVIYHHSLYSWLDKRKSPQHIFTKCHIYEYCIYINIYVFIYFKYTMNINQTQHSFMQHVSMW